MKNKIVITNVASYLGHLFDMNETDERQGIDLERNEKSTNGGVCPFAAPDTQELDSLARESLLKALIVTDIRLGILDEAYGLLHKFKELVKDKREERIWAEGMLKNITQ